jgi:hypothetical protein
MVLLSLILAASTATPMPHPVAAQRAAPQAIVMVSARIVAGARLHLEAGHPRSTESAARINTGHRLIEFQ